MFGCATANTTVVQCPVARVLEDPAQMTRFKPGAGRDITDIEFNVAFLENTGAGTCKIDDDKVDVELKVLIVAIVAQLISRDKQRLRFLSPLLIKIVISSFMMAKRCEIGLREELIFLVTRHRLSTPMSLS